MNPRNKGSSLNYSERHTSILDYPFPTTVENRTTTSLNQTLDQLTDLNCGPTKNPILADNVPLGVQRDYSVENSRFLPINEDCIQSGNIKISEDTFEASSSTGSITALNHYKYPLKTASMSAVSYDTTPSTREATQGSARSPREKIRPAAPCGAEVVSPSPRRVGRENGDKLPYLFKQLIRYYEKQQSPKELAMFRRAYFAYRYA